jgi:hypothetical protein
MQGGTNGSKEESSKEEGSKEENSKEEGSKEESSKEEGSKEENSKEESSKEEKEITRNSSLLLTRPHGWVVFIDSTYDHEVLFLGHFRLLRSLDTSLL